MADSVKDKVAEDLKLAKDAGKVRSDRVREIIATAVAQVRQELKQGSGEIRPLVKEAFTAAIAGVQDAGEDIKSSIEGVIDGISSTRRTAIAETEAKVKQLQSELEEQEDQLEQEIESSIAGIRDASKEAPAKVREQIQEAIEALQNTEEADLLRKRYAQVQAQLAILRANMAARTEAYYDKAQGHLDEAKSWYGKARPKAEELKGQADQNVLKLEQQLAEAGTALAQREQRVRSLLSDLLRSASDSLKDGAKALDKGNTTEKVLPSAKVVEDEGNRDQ
jgi:hypothetical protein